MSATDKTADEVFGSLNGFDEIGIAQAFRRNIADLRNDPFQFMRALVFIDQKRSGLDHEAARDAAMAMPLRELEDYFAPNIGELGPETESGKDSEPTES